MRDWPLGTHPGRSDGRRYLVSKSSFAKARSLKLVATEQGGDDYISLNLYLLANGPRLFACEMPVGKVVDFLHDLRPD